MTLPFRALAPGEILIGRLGDRLNSQGDEVAEVLGAIKNIATSSGKAKASYKQPDKTNDGLAFCPLPSARWVEYMSTAFRHAVWKIDTYNHLAPLTIKAFRFLGNLTETEIRACWRDAMGGNIKYGTNRRTYFEPSDLHFSNLTILDPGKCGISDPIMLQKNLLPLGPLEMKNLRKVWSVGRPYLRCRCKTDKGKDCGGVPIWCDHMIWFLLAHPEYIFPNLSSNKLRITLLIHYLRTSWKPVILACVTFIYIRDIMLIIARKVGENPDHTANSVVNDDDLRDEYLPGALARILLPNKVTISPTKRDLRSPMNPRAKQKRRHSAPLGGQQLIPFGRAGFQRVNNNGGARNQPAQSVQLSDAQPGTSTTEARHTPAYTRIHRRMISPRKGLPLPHERRTFRRERDSTKLTYVHLTFTSRVMEAFSLRQIIKERVMAHLGDGTKDWLDDVVFGWRYRHSLANLILNPAKVFDEFRLEEWMRQYKPEDCTCADHRYRQFHHEKTADLLTDNTQTHVLTLDKALGPHRDAGDGLESHPTSPIGRGGSGARGKDGL
ncbi:hypothetical protein CBR_g63101 [Chara braunii]|uniref:Uncharacterized protein n=1 Tax=Chara braunii TaxID=69332 RepID=A0A388K924_CHABU|nr:hypothetical protein CBR_g63101 [Chara braunii]|eukprot:GBG66519.1 hypothetical protein CBR_g63101 [Chara braunii]